jgi:hypothetical protein
MSTITRVPHCSDPCAARPRIKGDPKCNYRSFVFSDKDLLSIDTIQRLSIRAQGKPKQAVSMAAAVRLAIHAHAAKLEREAAKVQKRVASTSLLNSK